jgi:hypothetical protein
MYAQVCSESLKGRDVLENLSVDARVIIKVNLEKKCAFGDCIQLETSGSYRGKYNDCCLLSCFVM